MNAMYFFSFLCILFENLSRRGVRIAMRKELPSLVIHFYVAWGHLYLYKPTSFMDVSSFLCSSFSRKQSQGKFGGEIWKGKSIRNAECRPFFSFSKSKSKTKQNKETTTTHYILVKQVSYYRFCENSCNHENFCKPKLPNKFVKTAYNCVTGIWRKL